MKRIEKVGIVVTPVDFSDNSKLIAESAAFMAGRFQADLILLFVVQKFEDYSGFFVPHMSIPDFEQDLFSQAEDKMLAFCQELEAFAGEQGVKEVQGKVLVGDVAEQIVDFASEQDDGLIAMGTHGYKGLEKIMFGSVADKVVKSASCPVLTINPYTCCNK
ncbi:universal stress protein [Desulfotalea psychrophila]|uniref:Universal stress protein n=1 Tax=Desulfotalea psychrophila TaxID=84980 RepID=A0ABS3AXW8_9BACT|nr:universal stress protein [Desulfocapsa sp.]MBN4045945.1 universal stress protein [bacterium AH-315-P11]MBN4068732.1 universal stress protein [Desulfotalea psychrophila]MBN4071582.1 universal stress protein [Desulfotalea psychrophila]